MPRKLDREAACRSWDPYVRCLADLMGLKDWEVGLVHRACVEDAKAQLDWTEGTRHAAIPVSDDFLDEDDESEQRATIVHELIHCHFEVARVIAERAMGQRWEDFRLVFEQGIDAMEKVVAPRMPLPSHVKPKRIKKGP